METELLLKEIEELRKVQKELESKRYVDLSMAKFSSIMRWNTGESLADWADRLLMELTPYINGLQACLYSVKNTTDSVKKLQRIGVYAYEDDGAATEFDFGKGLVGQAAKSQRPFHIKTNTGQNQINCRTGLAAIQPAMLIIQPLIANDTVEGVLEVSLLQDLTPEEHTFLNLLAEAVATNLMTIRSQETMRLMFEEAQEAANALRAQEEELRQNAEEMQSTQEEMRRIQLELNGQIGALNNSALVSEADILGNITFVNEQFVRTSKYTTEELMGQNHRILKSGHQPQEIFDELWATISGGKVWYGEIKNRAKDGSYYWVRSTITPIKGIDGKPYKYIGVRFEISQMKIQEEMIRQSLEESQAQEEELRQNMEEMTAAQEEIQRREAELRGYLTSINSSMATIEFDMNGTIKTANTLFLKLMGYHLDEVVGKHHRIFVDPVYAATIDYQLFWENLNKGMSTSGEIQRYNKAGEPVWMHSTYTPVIGLDGRPYKVIKLATDSTERKRTEEEIKKKIA